MTPGDENHVMAARIADAVLADLDGREGFDHWWADVERDIRVEIRSELIDIAVRILDS